MRFRRRARDEKEPRPEQDEWGAELFNLAQGPSEGTAEERAAARRELHMDAAAVYDMETQAYIFLLAHMVHRLGGAVALTADDRQTIYSLGIDQSELRTTGVLRLFSVLQEGV